MTVPNDIPPPPPVVEVSNSAHARAEAVARAAYERGFRDAADEIGGEGGWHVDQASIDNGWRMFVAHHLHLSVPARFRHRARGSEYEIVGHATLQASTGPISEGATIVIYRGEDGASWSRELGEFMDGRFQRIERTADVDESGAHLRVWLDHLIVKERLFPSLADAARFVLTDEGKAWSAEIPA
jgi:hypothetical protein